LLENLPENFPPKQKNAFVLVLFGLNFDKESNQASLASPKASLRLFNLSTGIFAE